MEKEYNNSYNYNMSAKEIAEMLDVTAEKLPQLITRVLESFYSPEAGSKIGQSVGSLYKELVQAGLPQDVAVKMAGDYMFSLRDFTKLMDSTEQ
ncbi:hypothetical protein [Paenibacillus tarimensis]|uniref:hypothetical protein n=1 Tax=Paenibacillus tarimensis TaxID=416012 RepID=UPI001F281AB3|nr:hypothetical protein [Paenibacillus tarimensis]MCF2945254.1 hypothetical protein [Paenibacillus tarimensis]